MKPKAVTPRFITRHHGRVRRQLQSILRARNFLEHTIDTTGGNLSNSGALAHARCKPDLPAAFAQFERQSNVTEDVSVAAVDSVVRVMVIMVALLS
jgi:hypothetical protein